MCVRLLMVAAIMINYLAVLIDRLLPLTFGQSISISDLVRRVSQHHGSPISEGMIKRAIRFHRVHWTWDTNAIICHNGWYWRSTDPEEIREYCRTGRKDARSRLVRLAQMSAREVNQTKGNTQAGQRGAFGLPICKRGIAESQQCLWPIGRRNPDQSIDWSGLCALSMARLMSLLSIERMQ
jgi:hypothetical protein